MNNNRRVICFGTVMETFPNVHRVTDTRHDYDWNDSQNTYQYAIARPEEKHILAYRLANSLHYGVTLIHMDGLKFPGKYFS